MRVRIKFLFAAAILPAPYPNIKHEMRGCERVAPASCRFEASVFESASCVTVFAKLSSKLGSGLSRFCSSWVSAGVTDPVLRRRDTVLVGSLFSLPFVAAASTMLQPLSANSASYNAGTLAISFALPLLATGWLSLTGSHVARSLISSIVLPSLFLGLTHGQFHFAQAAIFVGVAAGVLKRENGLPTQSLLTGAILTAFAGFAADPNGFALSALLGLGAFALARLRLITASETVQNEGSVPAKIFDLLADKDTGFAIETSRDGFISQANGLGQFAPGTKFVDRVHVSDRVEFLTALDGLCAGLSQFEQLEVRLDTKTIAPGAGHYARVNLKLLKIDDRVLLSGQILEKSAPAADDQNLLLAYVSHEMRTPLNAIIGFSDMLEKGLAGPLGSERQSEYVELINRSGQHLLDVVNTMLDVAKADNGKFAISAEPFLPDETAMLAISMVARQAQAKRIGLDYMPLNVFETFRGDRRVCQQILVNLLSNAIKFTPQDGKIRLSVDQSERQLTIEVEDDGIGMSPTDLARAGTPFFQAKPQDGVLQEGTGLGLTLVRKMAALHGGAMEIESKSGSGTRVRVTLAEGSVCGLANISPKSVLRPPSGDESARIIYLSEESLHEAPRKTA